jgi:hypothetical protein
MADSPLPTFSPTNGDSPSSPTNQGPNHPFAPSSSANYSLNSPPGNGVGPDGGGDVSLNMNMNGGDVDVNGLDMGIEDILAQFGLPPMSVMGTSHEPHHLQHQQQPQQQQHEHVQRQQHQQHQQHQQQAAGVATGKVTPGGTGKGTPQSSHAPSPLNLQNSTSADSPGRIGRPSSRASSLLQSVHGNANAEHGGVNVAGHYRSSSASSSRSSGANLGQGSTTVKCVMLGTPSATNTADEKRCSSLSHHSRLHQRLSTTPQQPASTDQTCQFRTVHPQPLDATRQREFGT